MSHIFPSNPSRWDWNVEYDYAGYLPHEPSLMAFPLTSLLKLSSRAPGTEEVSDMPQITHLLPMEFVSKK